MQIEKIISDFEENMHSRLFAYACLHSLLKGAYRISSKQMVKAQANGYMVCHNNKILIKVSADYAMQSKIFCTCICMGLFLEALRAFKVF